LDRYDYKDRESYYRALQQGANIVPPPQTSTTAESSLLTVSRDSEAFDITLCADDLDGTEVRRIAEWLARRGLHPWPHATADSWSGWHRDQGGRLMKAKVAVAGRNPGRVAPGDGSPGAPTDPDVQIARIWLLIS
jgi:hypothetical protein